MFNLADRTALQSHSLVGRVRVLFQASRSCKLHTKFLSSLRQWKYRIIDPIHSIERNSVCQHFVVLPRRFHCHHIRHQMSTLILCMVSTLAVYFGVDDIPELPANALLSVDGK